MADKTIVKIEEIHICVKKLYIVYELDINKQYN